MSQMWRCSRSGESWKMGLIGGKNDYNFWTLCPEVRIRNLDNEEMIHKKYS